jgi:uncharacterized protein YbjT (DUF2867 family)
MGDSNRQQATTAPSETPAPAEAREHTAAPGKVLVTGGSGFVGRYVVRELIARGCEPVCVVRSREKLLRLLPEEQHGHVRTVIGDLRDAAALARAAEGCPAAIHIVGIIAERRLAGQTFERVHVEGTRQVVRACMKAGATRYVHMSALGSRPNAVSRYHQTKWAAEEMVRQSPLQWTIFRPSVIHGPDGEFIEMMKFFSTSKVRQPIMPYFGSGTAMLQPVSVRDVAFCFVKCLAMPETIGKVFELGGPERFTWKQLYDTCAEAIAGHRRLKLPVPVPVAKVLARTIMPFAPSLLVPYRFNVDQVIMSQEDSICDTGPVEKTFGIRLRDFRSELSFYADQIA